MNTKILILLFSTTAVLSSTFEQYIIDFDRKYSGLEKHQRKVVFEQNLKLINDANNQNSSFKLGLTIWSDRFDHQINDGVNTKLREKSLLKNSTISKNKLKIKQTEELVDQQDTSQQQQQVNYLDWRERNGVTPVREQGGCGACWAFATTATVQSNIYLKTNVIVDLSEEYIIECTGQDNDCKGGYFEDAYMFLDKMGGMPLESRYPYKAGRYASGVPSTDSDICNTTKLIEFNKDTKDGQKGFQVVYQDNVTNEDIQEALLQSPLSAHFASSTKFFQYKQGIFSCNYTITKNMINHGVQIVGFNSTGRYFIIKNSWGTKWGMDGFGYVDYDHDCGLKIRAYVFEQNGEVEMPSQKSQTNLSYEPLPLQFTDPQSVQNREFLLLPLVFVMILFIV